jgi:hypothetical protein
MMVKTPVSGRRIFPPTAITMDYQSFDVHLLIVYPPVGSLHELDSAFLTTGDLMLAFHPDPLRHPAGSNKETQGRQTHDLF